jgi:hypothetical protein
MAPDDYVRWVLGEYSLPSGPNSPAAQAAVELRGPIHEWTKKYLLDIRFAGSYAKGTRVRGSTDLDLLIVVGPRTPGTAQQLYDHFFSFLKAKGLNPRQNGILVELTYHGILVHLIPAKQQWGTGAIYEIFETERRRQITTSFDAHTKLIRESGRQEEIKATKIWRTERRLRFPSFCLELAVMEALRHHPTNQPANNLTGVLEYLRDSFCGSVIRDPSNSENIVSDDLMTHERIATSDAAQASLKERDWNKIIW